MCPGYVQTPLVEKQISDTAETRGIPEDEVVRDVILHAQPTKRFVTFQELNGLLLFLCSDAGASVNGAALPIDGAKACAVATAAWASSESGTVEKVFNDF